MLADTLLIFDHLTHKIKVVAHAHLDGDIEKSYKEATEKIDRSGGKAEKAGGRKQKCHGCGG